MTRRVLIGTTTLDGKVDAAHEASMLASQRACLIKGIDMRAVTMRGCSVIQHARNVLIESAVRDGYDDLVFTDADQDWPAEWLIKLLEYPVDCVGGAVRKKREEKEGYTVFVEGFEGVVVDPVTGLWLVAGLGCGFLRLSRRALLALWEAAEPYTMGGKPAARWIFDIHPVQGELMGEDSILSQKLLQHGIRTYLDPDMVCGHWGMKRYHGDLRAWIEAGAAAKIAAE